MASVFMILEYGRRLTARAGRIRQNDDTATICHGTPRHAKDAQDHHEHQYDLTHSERLLLLLTSWYRFTYQRKPEGEKSGL
jgi:hypothetical protein